ncbi:MAG: hypothetical protein H0V70_14500 [Ktedonobacteraceae bacterium]|nr:hypothetical protein [Ktedonobacteraceae bacterium]
MSAFGNVLLLIGYDFRINSFLIPWRITAVLLDERASSPAMRLMSSKHSSTLPVSPFLLLQRLPARFIHVPVMSVTLPNNERWCTMFYSL